MVWSDDGTNFTGAEKELARMVEGLKSRAVNSVRSKDQVMWKFNPPLHPTWEESESGPSGPFGTNCWFWCMNRS